jgi:dTDP-4-amino-4,6-dideoxygalactose transaminase
VAILEQARVLRFHGSRDKKDFEHIGYNSRLDEIQAAALRVALARVDDWNGRRTQAAEWYDLYLPPEVVRPAVPDGLTHVYHLYVVRTPRRDEVAAALKAREIGCAVYYSTPLHLQPALAHLGCSAGDFPATELAAAENLALPMHPNLTEGQVREVCATVEEGLS